MLPECQTAWIWVRHRVIGVSSRSKLFAYETTVMLDGLRVNIEIINFYFSENPLSALRFQASSDIRVHKRAFNSLPTKWWISNTIDDYCKQFWSRWGPTKCGASSEIQIVLNSNYVSPNVLSEAMNICQIGRKKYMKKLTKNLFDTKNVNRWSFEWSNKFL